MEMEIFNEHTVIDLKTVRWSEVLAYCLQFSHGLNAVNETG